MIIYIGGITDMKNLFSKVVLMILVLTMTVSIGMTVSAKEYPDDGYWANEAIDAAIANGLLYGKGNGNIESEANLTRAEMAAIMVRSFGASVKADASQYVDLDPSAWYYDEFAKAIQMRVFEGDGTGLMRPNDNITREEVFTVVARAMVLSNSDHSALNKFGDANQISSWARDYMSILTQKAYVNGDNLGNVNPKAYITRAEFAQLMYNIYKTYYLKTGSYSDTVDTACVMINTESVNLTNVVVNGDLIIGDGANLSTIKLTNVTIKGRLLIRGSARIELVKTTVGEMVVVNNYNSVVHFDNYRNEKVFDGIILNTKATFKQRGGGSVVETDSYVTVTFIDDNGDTVGTVELKKGNSMSDENKSLPNVSKSANGYVKNSGISSLYAGANEYTHVINWGWYIKPSNVAEALTKDWENFTVDTKVEENIEVLLRVREFKVNVFVKKLEDKLPIGFPFTAYYEPTTRFADSIKDIISNKTPLDALKSSGYWDNIKDKSESYGLIDNSVDNNIKIQSIMIRFSDVLGGEEKTREFIVDTAKQSLGNNAKLTEAFNKYVIAVVESTQPQQITGLLEEAIIYELNNDSSSVSAIQQVVRTMLADDDAFEGITGIDPSSLNTMERDYIVDETCALLETDSVDRTTAIDAAVEYLITPAFRNELNDIIDYSIEYLNNHPDKRDEIIDDIIDKIYKEELDTLVYELVNKDKFTVTAKISFVAEGLKNKLLAEYKYEDYIGNLIPDRLNKLFEIYPEAKLKEIYDNAIDNTIAQVDDFLTALGADSSTVGKIDSGLTVVIDPIADVYSPLYDGVVEFIKNKPDFHYNDNKYLPEFIKLLSPDSLFENAGNKSDTLTGYRIKSLDAYYDLIVKLVILGDDALVWYAKNSTVDEFERITDSYQQLILKYVNVAADILDAYANNGTLPNDKLSVVEEAIKEKFPELINNLVAWYKDSDINKDYDDGDFQKVQDSVRKAFENINITTDEFFDLILNNKRLENIGKLDEYFEKVSEDEYKFEVKGNIVTFLRDIVDA